MYRFYIPRKLDNNFFISNAEQLHHLKDVLRLKVDDEVIVFDSKGLEYVCSIKEFSKEQAVLTVKSSKHTQAKKARITVACAIPKKAEMDDIVNSLTQLGVDDIIPLETERVIVKLDDKKRETRLERWQRIAQSAAQQSQRNSIPLVMPITSIENVVSHSQDFDLKLIATLSSERKHIKEALAESKPNNILVLIGPEGDFTRQEINLAKCAGFIPVSLGDYVLRVGTAAVAIVSYVKFTLIT